MRSAVDRRWRRSGINFGQIFERERRTSNSSKYDNSCQKGMYFHFLDSSSTIFNVLATEEGAKSKKPKRFFG